MRERTKEESLSLILSSLQITPHLLCRMTNKRDSDKYTLL